MGKRLLSFFSILGVFLPSNLIAQTTITPAHDFTEPLWYFGIFLGIIFTNIIISVVQYLLSKDKAFLYYTLFLLFNMLYFLHFYGDYGNSSDFFSQLPPNVRMGFLLSGYIIYSFFAIEFLKLSTSDNQLASKLKNLAWINFGIMIIYFITFQAGWKNEITANDQDLLVHHLALIGVMITGLYGLYLVYHVRTVLSNILVIGATLYFIGSVSGFILASFPNDFSPLWKNFPLLPTQIGFLLEMLFFSIGLSYRAYIFQKEKKQTNEKYIQQLKENQLLELEKKDALKYKELNELKSQIYTNITHEFRTPLTVILGLAEQLEKNPKYKLESHLATINRNGHQLLNLVNQLLELNKLEEGSIEPKYIQANIIHYLKYIAESFQSFAMSKQRNLSFFSAVEEEVIMDYDPDKMLRILSNLIFNAIKFTPEFGKIQVTVQKDISNNALQIKIADTGQGIPEEALPFIFDRFYQVKNNSTTSVEGTGIGLALVKELAELMDGNVSVKSIVGKGTTFELFFPIKNNAPIEVPNLKNISPQFNPSKSSSINELSDPLFDDRPILLIVEDNDDVTDYLKSSLVAQYQFLLAPNGKIGLDKATEFIPDIIISDVMMPEMDGLTLCEKLKNDERTNHIPIILLTAKSSDDDRLQGLTKGADAYLPKPFNQDELSVILENLVQVRKNILEKNDLKLNKKPASPFLQKLNGIILSKLEDADFDITRLCQAMELSRAQIHRKVKALTEHSTTKYIRIIKLREAKKLLETTSLNVSEVAYKIGYKNPSNFSTHFKAYFGFAPNETHK